MSGSELLKSAVAGMVSGYLGLQAMTPVTTKMQAMESPQDAEREKQASPGVAYTIAARDLAKRIGKDLTDDQANQLGTVFHLGLGLAAGELYMVLRRGLKWNPGLSGLIVASILWAGLDEGLTPAMGWSAPAGAYPMATHVRGAVGHLTLGATVAVSAEVFTWLRED